MTGAPVHAGRGRSGIHWPVVALTFLAVLLDGFDTATLAASAGRQRSARGLDRRAWGRGDPARPRSAGAGHHPADDAAGAVAAVCAAVLC
jgi:hypothetical protein